jgi:hypothetical protein
MADIFNISEPSTGNFFIGRKKELAYLWENIFLNAFEGKKRHIKITGMNRIGKTSLMANLTKKALQENNPKTFILSTSLEGYNRFWPYWINRIIYPILESFERLKINLEEYDITLWQKFVEIKEYFNNRNILNLLYIDDEVEFVIGKMKIEQLFSLFEQIGLNGIILMDEFDLAGNVFGKQKENFAWLRYFAESKAISLVTLSRRSVYYIEKGNFDGSILAGIFSPFVLHGFSNQNIDEFFEILQLHNLDVTPKQKEQIVYYCGRSPYYLALMANAMNQSHFGSQTDISTIFSKISSVIHESFDRVIRLLESDQLLLPMIQMFVGPAFDLRSDQIESLKGLGYCFEKSEISSKAGHEYFPYFESEKLGNFLTISDYFVDYLSDVKKVQVQMIFPLLNNTENWLRAIIIYEFKKNFGKKWEIELNNIIETSNDSSVKERHDLFYQKGKEQFNRLNSLEKEGRIFIKLNVVSYFVLRDIFYSKWNLFKKYFNSNKKDLNDSIELMYNSRNPYAHNNKYLIGDRARDLTIKACKSLIEKIEKVAKPLNIQPEE